MAYTLTREPLGICKRFSGHVGGAEFLRAVIETQNQPDFDRLHYTINDLSSVESFDIDEPALMQFAAYGLGSRPFNRQVRMAVICHQPGIVALVDQFLALATVPLRRFEDEAAARAWLAQADGPV